MPADGRRAVFLLLLLLLVIIATTVLAFSPTSRSSSSILSSLFRPRPCPCDRLPFSFAARLHPPRTRLAFSSSSSSSSSTTAMTIPTFLTEARAALLDSKQHKIKVVIGNEAADADTIVSSICLAHYLHATRSSEDSAAGVQYAPVLPLPRAELKLRPETLLLFRLAGLKETVKDMICIDEVNLAEAKEQGKLAGLVLVDHNKLTEPLQGLGELIETIVDHHEDQGLYNWVTDVNREIAFSSDPAELDASQHSTTSNNNHNHNGNSSNSNSNGLGISRSLSTSSSVAGGRALVASTCTLVAERYLSSSSSSSSPSLLTTPVALLLLGVILLDSVCLDGRAGKVTPRDEAAAQALMEIVVEGREGGREGGFKKEGLYKQLSGAKFDQEWWRSLEVEEALGLDYKSFTASPQTRPPLRYGMSSVLVSLEDLLSKSPSIETILQTFALPEASNSSSSYPSSCPRKGRRTSCSTPHNSPPPSHPPPQTNTYTDLLSKAPSIESILQTFATTRSIELLVLMSLVMPQEGKEDEEVLQRALAIYTPDPSFGAGLVELLLSPGTEAAGLALEPVEIGGREGGGGGEGRKLWCFRQGNTQASRKQVEPILRRVLEEQEGGLFSK